MGKSLIICEKPEVAKDITDAILINPQIEDGYSYDSKYIVTYCYGHLLQLVDPEYYDKKFSDRKNLTNLPIYFNSWKKIPFENDKNKNKQFKIIEILLTKVNEVIHAGDPDEEGQLLVDELIEYFGFKGEVKRVLINDNTPSKIIEAFSNLENNDKFKNLGNSAYARQLADKTFGINESRLASVKLSTNLSIGRVQTPTLSLVVNRDALIENHIKEKYLNIRGSFCINDSIIDFEFKPNESFLEKLQTLENSKIRSTEKTNISEMLDAEVDRIFACDVEYKNAKENPPLPYSLTTLQADMNRRYSLSLSETLKITQNLRDKYKAITYNRSDCEYLDPIHFEEGLDVLNECFKNINKRYLISKDYVSKCFDSRKVKAHHAIIPQKKRILFDNMTNKEKVVYKAIVDRYALQYMPPVSKTKVTLTIRVPNGNFIAKLCKINDPGFKSQFLPKEKLIGDDLSFLRNRQMVNAKFIKYKIEIKETNPLPKYTPETLIKDMANISKYCNEETKKILIEKDKDAEGGCGGIGTVATRAGIVDLLLKRNFLIMQGKYIVSTDLGKNFINILPFYLKTADLTAKWYLMQREVKKGANPEIIMMNVVEEFNKHKDIAYNNKHFNFKENSIYGKCPICGGNIKKHNKKRFYYCESSECDFVIFSKIKYFDNEINMTDNRVIKLLKNVPITAKVKGKEGKEYSGKFKLVLKKYNNKVYANLERVNIYK